MVINEILLKGQFGETDEFLELRNVSSVPVDLTGFTLRFYSSNCITTATVTLPQDTVVQPANSLGQYVVVTGLNFAGEIDDQTYVVPVLDSNDLMPTKGGAVSLHNLHGSRVDTVGWTPCLKEGGPARIPPQGLSLSRNHLSRDTDNNRTDFTSTPQTPGAQPAV
ncbi:lamin tail domain-containing protein [Amycolatopsis azurea]|uniref:lamin tail domain-containing protein n=1 Tax=Amycolatopsis azurea TaxID=36819 RepID=UPI00034AFE47|nr:lamin tail domain-containing protein [Amycolatopsis azurea]